FDPEGDVFKKGARNGMHTFEDATLIVEGHDVGSGQNDDIDIMDVAPTVLDLLEVDVPEEMDGESLV
ncbi:MAG: nucleotide pyrophosphatase, partial [Halobacteria archaeon]|nr:nucleotide pyrophosphatase [Halobacteria archaeon]